MKKTALQELIDELEASKMESLKTDPHGEYDYRVGIHEAIRKAKALLPKEREYLEEAFNYGVDNPHFGGSYVNQTFEQ